MISADETATRQHGVAVIGLGSMGKRRIRCLRTLGVGTIAGVDPREDRRREAADASGVPTYPDLEQALDGGGIDALCISVPPHLHGGYLRAAVDRRLPAFVEAGVLADGLREAGRAAAAAGVVLIPSSTMLFHPAIRLIAEVVESGRLGRISNLTHHCGNHLPSWHPWEPLTDLYASRRETGGAREMVAFELRWLTRLMGLPRRALGMRARTAAFEGADIDDTYSLLLDWAPAIGSLVVEVVARPSVRVLRITGESGQLQWDWAEHRVSVYDPETDEWEHREYAAGPAQPGYDPRIGERMYVDECEAFLAALDGGQPFPNDVDRDLAVLDVLYEAERTT